MDIKNIFQAISQKMLQDFELIHTQIKHPGGKGSERELGLQTFLSSYLPARYSLSSGEIVDSTGSVSRQCDIVIYNSTECPLLMAGNEYRIFPAEPIYAVVEVKSVLNNKELDIAAENIRSIKCLKRDNGKIAGVVFAYKSGYGNNTMEKITDQLQRINREIGEENCIDLLCILDVGIITVINSEGINQVSAEKRQMLTWLELTPPVLLWFFINLLHLLSGQKSGVPDYIKYAHILDVGVVSLRNLS